MNYPQVCRRNREISFVRGAKMSVHLTIAACFAHTEQKQNREYKNISKWTFCQFQYLHIKRDKHQTCFTFVQCEQEPWSGRFFWEGVDFVGGQTRVRANSMFFFGRFTNLGKLQFIKFVKC